MSTEVWFRNPDNYIRELVEVGEKAANIAWDRGMLVKRSIDPYKHASLYFGRAIQWRALLVGDQGTAEIGPDNDISRPKGVYPTWFYGEDAALLEEIVARPVGADKALCFDLTVPVDQRPVYNQEHRVVICDVPAASGGPGRKFLKFLKELQEDYPDCIIHVHGLYGYRAAFGLGFRAADTEPRTLAQKGKVTTISGREMLYERLAQHPQWCTPLGFKPVELKEPRNRCIFNIKSALWAGERFMELHNFALKNTGAVDVSSPDADHDSTAGAPILKGKKPKDGDQFHCDTCSLQLECKYQRDGAVCSVPGAEPTELARYFKTRDSGTIIDGLGTLMAAQTKRLERGMEDEDTFGELDPEVTKILNSLFEQGVKLAKLVDPALRTSAAKVQVNVGNMGAQIAGSNPRAFMAEAVRTLELQGIKREDITPKMIEGLLDGMGDHDKSRRAIEGTVLHSETE